MSDNLKNKLKKGFLQRAKMARAGAIFLLFVFLALTQSAKAQFTYADSFITGQATNWVFGGSTNSTTPFLTSGNLDPSNNGWLRLTGKEANQSTYAYFKNPIPTANNAISIQLDLAMWNQAGIGAGDGFTIFLYDADVDTFNPGAYGGSLGYAQKTGINGLSGGFVGIGFDNFGNYSNPTEGRIGGIGEVPNAIAVRGPGDGQTGYNYLGGTTNLPYGLDFGGYTNRPNQTTELRRVLVELDEENLLTVSMQFGTNSFVNLFSLTITNERPENLKIGYAASTGDAMEIHEVRNLVLTSSAFPLTSTIWDGGGTNNVWGNATNWLNDAVPVNYAAITFGTNALTNRIVNLQTNRLVSSVTFSGTNNYTLTNNTLIFASTNSSQVYLSAVIGDGTGASNTIFSSIITSNKLTVTAQTNTTLRLAGVVDIQTNRLTVAGHGTNIISGTLIGSEGLTKMEVGTLYLQGTNTFSGSISNNGGKIVIGAEANLGNLTNDVFFNGGTLQVTNSFTVSTGKVFSISTNGGGTFQIDATKTLTLGTTNQLTGAGKMTKAGEGTLLLATNNSTFSGGVDLVAGKVDARNDLALGTGLLTLAGGTLLSGDGANRVFTNSLTVANATTNGIEVQNGQQILFTANSITATNGTLQLTNTTGSGTGSVAFSGSNYTIGTAINVGTNVDLRFSNTNGTQTIAGNISGGGNVVRTNGNGTTLITGSNSYTGTTLINSGTLIVGSTNALGATNGGTIVGNNGTLGLQGNINYTNGEALTLIGVGSGTQASLENISGTNVFGGPITLAGTNNTIGGTTNSLLTLTGAIGGGTTNNLVKIGSGTIAISSSNSYAGETTISNGTLVVTATGALGATNGGTTVANGATLAITNNITVADRLTVTGTGVGGLGVIQNLGGTNTISGGIVLNSGSNGINTAANSLLDVSGQISGSGSLLKTGAGTLVLETNNTFSGGVNLTSGKIDAQNDLALGTGLLTMAGGTLLSGDGANRVFTNSLTLANTTTNGIEVQNGQQILFTANSVTATNGTLRLTNTTGSGTGSVAFSGSNYTVGTAINVGTNVDLRFSNTNGTQTISGNISGGGNIVRTNGDGTTLVTGTNTYTGTTLINSGTLIVGSTTALGATNGGTIVGNGGTLGLQGNIDYSNGEALTLIGGGSGTQASLENISDTNIFGGRITLAGTNNTIGGTAGSILYLTGQITGGATNNLVKIGNGSTIVMGSNSYTGETTISNGILAIVNDYALGATNSGTTIASGGTLLLGGDITVRDEITINGTGFAGLGAVVNYTGNNTLANTVTLAGAGNNSIDIASGTILEIDGTIAGGSGSNLVKTGTGTLILTTNNTYEGTTTVSGGTLIVTSTGALGATNGGTTIANGATLAITNGITIADTLTVTGTGVGGAGVIQNTGGTNTISGGIVLNSGTNAIDTANNSLLDVTGQISGTGALTKTGAGTLSLETNNTYSGTTTVSGGTLLLTATGALGTTNGGTTIANGATLALTNNITVADTLTVTGTGVSGGGVIQNLGDTNTISGGIVLNSGANAIDTDGDSRLNVTGIISGSGALNKIGSGLLSLSASNTYTGTTTISNGTISIESSERISDQSSLALNGGKILLNGNTERINNLSFTEGGMIDYGTTGTSNNFLFQDDATSTGALLVDNWESSTDKFAFRSTNSVSSAYMQSIYFLGYGPGALGTSNQTVGGYGNGWTYVIPSTNYTIWDGGDSNDNEWNSPDNWVGNVKPASDSLVRVEFTVATNTRTTPNLDRDWTVNSLKFSTNSKALTMSGGPGDDLTLAGIVPSIIQLSTNNQVLNFGINLATNNIIIDTSGSGTLTLGGVVRGSFGFEKYGDSKLILTNNNTYAGDTDIHQGTVNIQRGGALGSTNGITRVDAGAALEIQNNITVTNQRIVLAGSGVTNSGALRNVSGTNNWNGSILLSSNATIASDAGALLTLRGNITNAGNDLTLQGAGNIVASNVISGSGGLIKDGTGTVSIVGGSANTYTGTTYVNAGTLLLNQTVSNAIVGNIVIGDGVGGVGADILQLGNSNQISDASTVTINSSGRFDLNNRNENVSSVAGTGQVTLGSGTLGIVGTNSSTYGGAISGTGALVKNGTGVLSLTGSNSYTGLTTISNGAINVQSSSALGTAAGGTVVASGGSLQLQSNVTVTGEALTLNGTGGGDGALRNMGNTNTWTGAITLGSASTIASDAGKLTVSNITASANQLTVTGSGDTVMAGTTTGSGGLVKQGDGTLTLTGSTTPGTITISQGTLMLGSSDRIGNTTPMVLNGGEFNSGGYSETLGTLTLSATSNIDLNSGTTSKLNFANSSGTTWSPSALLVIQGWSGVTNGGAAEGIYFGNNSSGLSAAQIAQIRFENPAGYGAGYYGARILSSGEIVPVVVPEPSTVVGVILLAAFIGYRERKLLLKMAHRVGILTSSS